MKAFILPNRPVFSGFLSLDAVSLVLGVEGLGSIVTVGDMSNLLQFHPLVNHPLNSQPLVECLLNCHRFEP